ncbi:hypothetical protein EZV73_25460 [Acidaminobacter sp. JC074]|uniref:non-canonical purine NTP pyrophosphatase n=1 Tax=Acidaminobacter sp. JC074 TaxID=2530199 RepID=UPI001F0FEEA7|nr:non-canonical purine NTP pyrophosphatase [Acidaminobacter sp. JC074]MCH4890952.1 hypothetical protein [Acidaminobacter sp. JC074]
MKFVYGTKNTSKIAHMKHILKDMHIEIEGLDENVDEPVEDGKDTLSNARIKAMHYYKQVKRPVFSADSGLYFEDVEDCDQPGKFIRRVDGKSLTDEEMIDHYSKLSRKYGGKLKAYYHNSICLVLDEDHIIEYDGSDLNSEVFYIVEKPHKTRKPGFPLDALSVEISSGSYYDDLTDYIFDNSTLDKGFQDFFKRVLRPEVTIGFKDFGKVKVELYPYYAPDCVRNFIELIEKDYYKDKSIVRVVPGRLIQSGDDHLHPENWTDDTPGYILNGEFNRPGFKNPLDFKRGTLGMAMAADHKTDYSTAGSFFIMTRDEPSLNEIVPAFGRVTDGMAIVDKMNQVKTHTDYGYDAPVETIQIESIVVDKKGVVYDSPKKIGFDQLRPTD